MRNTEYQEIDREEIRQQVLAKMRELDCEPYDEREIIIDGELHRYTINGDKRSSQNGAYRIFTDGLPAGFIQDWRKGTKTNWTFNTDNLSKDKQKILENKEFKKHILESQKKRMAEEKKRNEAGQSKAYSYWVGTAYDKCPKDFPYLMKKQIGNYDFRIDKKKNVMLVPLRNVDGAFISLQTITPEGEKRFFSDAPIEGGFWSVGLKELDPEKGTLLIGEGVATMATVHELSGLPCVAAMDCGRLLKISEVLKKKYPKVKILIAADNDKRTEDRTGKNPGLIAAQECVSKKIAYGLFYPTFAIPEQGSDWNDFAVTFGGDDEFPDYVKNQFFRELRNAAMTPEEKKAEAKISNLLKHIHKLDPNLQIPEQEFIGGLFPRKFITLVAAPSGTGKTLFTQRCASDLSIGGTFFDGFAENEPVRKVLIFAGEAGYEMLIRRGASFKWPINPDNVEVIDQHEFELDNLSVMLDDDEGWENTKKIIDLTKPDIVFWDTFSAFHDRDENKAVEMKPILRKIAKLAEEKNFAAVLNHHSRKRAASERNLSLSQDDVIGSSILNRLVALIIGIEPSKDIQLDPSKEGTKKLFVKPLKSWFAMFSPFAFMLEEDMYGHTHMQTDLAPSLPGNSKLAVWNYLQKNFSPGEWFSLGQFVLSEIEGNLKIRQIRNIVNGFVTAGKVEKRGENKWTEYSISQIQQ